MARASSGITSVLFAILIAALGLVIATSTYASATTTISVNVTNNVTIGDGEAAAFTLIVSSDNITQSPAADVGFTLRLSSLVFNESNVRAVAYYIEKGSSVKHYVTPSVSVSTEDNTIIVDTSVYVGSISSTGLTLNLTVLVNAKRGVVNQAGVDVKYFSTIYSGDNYDTPSGDIRVYIVPKPPSISIKPEYPVLSPGLTEPILINTSDASGVASLNITIFANGAPLYTSLIGSMETGNATVFAKRLLFNDTDTVGNYTVVVKACDIIGSCSTSNTSFRVVNTFTVPDDFPTVSSALSSPVVGNGVTILVKTNITENETINVDKAVTVIGASPGVSIRVNNSIGFNLTVADAGIEHIRLVAAGTAIMLCTGHANIIDVNATSKRFIKLCRPEPAYFNNTVRDSYLNGSKVLYIYSGRGVITGTYIEAHIYSSNMTLNSSEIGLLELGQSSLEIQGSHIARLVDLGGSNITALDTLIDSYTGTPSTRLEGYQSLTVRILYNGTALQGVSVTVAGGLLDEPLAAVTGLDGKASFNILVAWGTIGLEENYTAIITASYNGLENRTIVDLKETHYVELSLPVPSMAASLSDLYGNTVSRIKPGQILFTNISYDLKGFNAVANVTIKLIDTSSNKTYVEMTLPLRSPRASQKLLLIAPWIPGDYKVVVVFELQGLPRVTITLP